MIAYILGASKHAGYPLASNLLHSLADWLEVRETSGSLDDFEEILGTLEDGHERVKPPSPTTYRQNVVDIIQDCHERLGGRRCGTTCPPAGKTKSTRHRNACGWPSSRPATRSDQANKTSYGFSLSGLPAAGLPFFPTSGPVTRRDGCGRNVLSTAPVISERIEVCSAAARCRSPA